MRARQQQSGFALLLFMVVMIGFVIAGFSGLLTSSLNQKNEQNKIKNTQVLLEAKEALLSYAVNYVVEDKNSDGSIDLHRMGRLPCPDIDGGGLNEGSQDANCGLKGENTIGYFPFKTVGLGKIEDSSKECLWYVVSGSYKNNPDKDMLNWDSVSYLNLVDEVDNLKHGDSPSDYPVAFIISPGKSISQNRDPVAELPRCKSNFILSNYLEGGPNLNYVDDLPQNSESLWRILTASTTLSDENINYNDQVIAIYRSELWDRVRGLNDLSINAVPPTRIELLTKSLSECIAAYGNNGANNTYRRLPYPAPLDLDPTNTGQDEYQDNDNYDDDASILYGRFPQVLNGSVWNTNNFVLDASAAQSYCEPLVSNYDELFWQNWKDHFFYIVSQDFESATSVLANTGKCSTGNCINILGRIDKVAAMVIFSGSALPELNQSRIWWWDEASNAATIDEKANVNNYLEGDNQTVYVGGPQAYDLTTSTSPNGNDFSYCIEYNNTTFDFTALKCSDLDNIL